MGSYKDIDVSSEDGKLTLRRIIAEKLGWKFTDLNSNPAGLTVRGPRWIVISPEGEEWRLWQWQHLFSVMDLEYDLLDYANDLEAAASLPVEDGVRLSLYIDTASVTVEYYRADQALEHLTGYMHTLASVTLPILSVVDRVDAETMARCLAWIDYVATRKAAR